MVENRIEREESPNKWNAAAFGFAKDFAVSAVISGVIRAATAIFYRDSTNIHSIDDWWKQGRWKLDGVIALAFGAFGAFEEYNRAVKDQKRQAEAKNNRRENAELRQMLEQAEELNKERPSQRVEATSSQAEALLAEANINQSR